MHQENRAAEQTAVKNKWSVAQQNRFAGVMWPVVV